MNATQILLSLLARWRVVLFVLAGSLAIGLLAIEQMPVRYTASASFIPQLQINARVEKRESGANADVENSGASLVYLSPGVTWNISRRFSAYAFFQVPLYQRVNGLQIEPTQLYSIGMHYIF